MKRVVWFLAVVALVMAALPVGRIFAAAKTVVEARKEYENGNYKDAYENLSRAVLSEAGTDDLAGDFNTCLNALDNLARTDEVDGFREAAVVAHAKDWKFLAAVAGSYLSRQHYGVIIAGKFLRGNNRGGDGKWVDAFDRDRVRALQLLLQGKDILANQNRVDTGAAGQLYLQLAQTLLQGENGADAWRLQTLTDVTTLPDYDESGRPYYYRGYNGSRGAPVDEKGDPVLHQVPKKGWDSAVSDGERWRWALLQATEISPALSAQVKYEFADFLQGQFGVQTMAEYGGLFRASGEEGKKDESGPFAVHTLKDSETIAKLASGIKRFSLPGEFNPIQIFTDIANDPENGYASDAMERLGQIYEDRQQYDTAAGWWKKAISKFGAGPEEYRTKRLAQILDNWGMFENVLTQPAGDAGAKVDFRFRNASKVSFTANEIDVAALLGDVKDFVRSKPKQLDWEKIDLSNIGYRLVEMNQKKYLGKEAVTWDLALTPRENHFDKRVTVETPLKKAGAYLVTAKLENGNVSRIVIWVADTVIVRKTLSDGIYTYVADAASGQPVSGAKVDFFGYQQKWIRDQRYDIYIKEDSQKTDGDGQVVSGQTAVPADYSWVTTATTKEGRLAFLGFTGVWYGEYQDQYDREYNQTKAFVITDRPVYRPGQKVEWKMWVGQNKYDQDGKSAFAGETAELHIDSPKGDVVKRISGTMDEFGGISGEFELEKDATLGNYSITSSQGWGGVSFRVEEYKKPEFEVKVDAPGVPMMLGDRISATISAKYYFGAAVTNAKVKYTIKRTSCDARWYPVAYWDWFYEPGYWWFGADYNWYPGFSRWGCLAPVHHWWRGGWSDEQPEVVSENEVAVGADGTVKVEIDTKLAQAAHGDTDHQYEITAEVTDASRRTIVGTGRVLVAREPFKVYAWTENGYYHVGDSINAHFMAQTIDNKPVQGTGELKLFRVTYDEKAQPVETEVQRWDLNNKDDGTADLQINAKEAGQYRLSYSVLAKGSENANFPRPMEGGYVFVIRGEGFTGKEFRFNDIEVTTDKKQYAAGEKIKLMISANRADSTVLLFLRPSDGVYLAPKVIRLTGKSVVTEVEVGAKDMPNFFIEALTVANARVYTDVREVFVPPADRVLNVSVTADAGEYKPGQKAKLTVHVTEKNGEPFTGSAVVALYDKSVEYISGGSNVGDIRKYFWQWRRQHYVNTETSVDRWSSNLLRSGETGMGFLGVFGQMATEYGVDTGVAVDNTVAPAPLPDMAGVGGSVRFGARVMPAAPMSVASAGELRVMKRVDGEGKADISAANVEPTVRSNFADTAYWAPALLTAKDGTAEVEVTMPENLSTWKAKVWTLGNGTRVGEGSTEIITTKKLIVRMEAPRFFVQTDEVTLSSIVHNYLKTEKKVQVVLEANNKILEPSDYGDYLSNANGDYSLIQSVTVPAGGEKRVDWRVRAADEGIAKITMKALTDEESDATEQSFPVYVHGMLKTDSFSGAIRGDVKSQSLTINVPKERRPEQSRLEIRYSPTLAGAMVDALPYLADYPYGCTEQTLNRFVPTVITQKILLDMHLDLDAIRTKRTNLNAQEIGDAQDRAKQWKRFEDNPVFDKNEVDRMVRSGITALTNMQLSDGGWGWFSGYGEQSYPHTTAVVLHGLQIAKANGAAVDENVLGRGVEWLKKYQAEQIALLKAYDAHKNEKNWNGVWKEKADNVDAFVYMVLVDADVGSNAMEGYLYRDRTALAVYSKCMFGLALEKQKRFDELDMILQNVSQFVVQDEEDQTAYLRLPEDNYWWCWYGSEYEANGYYLKLLSLAGPGADKRGSKNGGQQADWSMTTASRLAKYVINNRKNATYWNSTRDTAVCVEALADYIRASKEDAPDMTVHVAVDGKEVKAVKITSADLFTFDGTVVLTGAEITDGAHKIDISREGAGSLYFNAYLTNFTLEPHITRAGLEVKVNRKVYKLTRADKTIKAEGARGQAVDQKVEKYERTELADGAAVNSGDLVEIELEVDSKNDYEYVVLEDMKAAGFEPVEVQSGYNGNDMNAYVEFRDNRVAFFVRELSRGKHSVSYRLRAEIPGAFSALPARASAMYAPELKGNSDEIKLKVFDDPRAAH